MILLDGVHLTLRDLVAVADDGASVGLAPAAIPRVDAARAVVERLAAGTAPVYGVNTGFGSFAETSIPPSQLARLQLNLLRSHAAGTGTPLPVRSVRAAMALRVNALARGFSGIARPTVEQLIGLLNRGLHPWVPSRGSVGASGDLAPLAHIALVLVGEGHTWDGERRHPAATALAAAGFTPCTLGPKEGLALINGTQASTAVLALALDAARRLTRAADVIAAMSVDALRGSVRPFDSRIHAERPLVGQQEAAANLRQLLAGSPINHSHRDCTRVQDAYSLRCVPQVHGAARDAVRWIDQTVAIEMNAATDNPMVFMGPSDQDGFGDIGEMVSGGNFHGAPIAIAADLLAISVSHLATISERRTERLVNPALSGLPAFLTRDGGLQSGLMLAQVTAAALTSELKTLAHPASVDTIPTSGNKEDHVSMSMGAALKAERAVELARTVLAVELLCATQALDLLAPLQTALPLARAAFALRARVPHLDEDRPPAPDIAEATAWIASGDLERATGLELV